MTAAARKLAEFIQLSKDIAPAARAVLMARAFEQTQRERVNAYIMPIFTRYGFTYDLECSGQGQLIENPEQLYLSTDEARVAEYFAECDTAHRAHGADLPAGHCPALRASNLRAKTEQQLIELAAPFFGIDPSQLFRAELRGRFLDLIIGAALKGEGGKR